MSSREDSWPPDWQGEVCFIIGGGPSVADIDPERLRGRRVIAINEAGLTVFPWADVLFWSDRRWYGWNKNRLVLHTGDYKVHRHDGVVPGAHRVKFRPGQFCDKMPEVGGHDSGSSSINLAFHLKCLAVVLVGFECRDLPMDRWREGNFHSMHPEPPIEGQRERRFLPAHREMKTRLGGRMEVYNATPDSALDCWEKVDLESLL